MVAYKVQWQKTPVPYRQTPLYLYSFIFKIVLLDRFDCIIAENYDLFQGLFNIK